MTTDHQPLAERYLAMLHGHSIAGFFRHL